MPTYDYECTQCGHVYEKFHAISDEPEKVCPECGGLVKRRIGTGAGIIFKGGGFYTTDYRSKEYKEKAKSETSSSSAPAPEKKTESGGSSDKKPASPAPAPAPKKPTGDS
jgi:putative FmdB family regulatory protein